MNMRKINIRAARSGPTIELAQAREAKLRDEELASLFLPEKAEAQGSTPLTKRRKGVKNLETTDDLHVEVAYHLFRMGLTEKQALEVAEDATVEAVRIMSENYKPEYEDNDEMIRALYATTLRLAKRTAKGYME